MAKEKAKRAGGRLIGNWKQDAITANPGASDEDLARIINEMARLQGYDYTIAPSKVRTKTTKPAAKPMSPAAPSTPRAPSQIGGALRQDLQTFVGLVGKEGARDILNHMIDRL